MPAAHTDFNRAFRTGEVFEYPGLEQPLNVRAVEVAELILTSGRIVACEPSFLKVHEVPPFTRSVPPGKYPVILSLARLIYPKREEERVACALVRLLDTKPCTWEIALRLGEDPATLAFDSFFGYGVDGGCGGFLDADLMEALAGEREQFSHNTLHAGPITSHEQIVALYPPFFRRLATTVWQNKAHVVDHPETGANVVEFSSGWGDGAYASYWGLDDQGRVSCLVTDFGVLIDVQQGEATLPLKICLEGPLHHPDWEQTGLKVRVRWKDRSARQLLVEHEDGECQPVLKNDGAAISYHSYRGNGYKGCYTYRFSSPPSDDATLTLTFRLGSRAL